VCVCVFDLSYISLSSYKSLVLLLTQTESGAGKEEQEEHESLLDERNTNKVITGGSAGTGGSIGNLSGSRSGLRYRLAGDDEQHQNHRNDLSVPAHTTTTTTTTALSA